MKAQKCEKRKFLFPLILWLVIILLIPLILNLALGRMAPSSIHIVGNDVDWLLFWGSYLGGIITATIGFFTLFISQKNFYETIKQHNDEQIEQFKLQQAKELEKELSMRVESMSMCAHVRILNSVIKSPLTKEEAIHYINNLSDQLEIAERQLIAWCTISWPDDMSTKPSEFDNKYALSFELFRDDTISTIQFLRDTITDADPNIQEKAKKLSDKLNGDFITIWGLFSKNVNVWIRKETYL